MASRGDKGELTGTATHFLSFSLWVSLPCSLVPKLMGKFSLNWQVKLMSLKLRKATCTVSVLSYQQHRGRGAPINHWLQLRNWYSGHPTDGVLGSQLLFCIPTPQITLKRYEVPLPCAKQGRCFIGHSDASAPFQTQPCYPWHDSFPQKKTQDRKTLGLLWALLLCPS